MEKKINEQPIYLDDDLVKLIKQGEEFAFDLLFKRYWEKMYYAALKRFRDSDLAKDIVQEIFFNLWKKKENLEINNFSAYIFTALKYAIIDHIRFSSSREKYISEIIKTTIASDYSTENQVNFNELSRIIEQKVNLLPEKCRQVFLMRRKENFSLKEIAKTLNISEKTVENHMSKALKDLSLHLKEFLTLFL